MMPVAMRIVAMCYESYVYIDNEEQQVYRTDNDNSTIDNSESEKVTEVLSQQQQHPDDSSSDENSEYNHNRECDHNQEAQHQLVPDSIAMNPSLNEWNGNNTNGDEYDGDYADNDMSRLATRYSIAPL